MSKGFDINEKRGGQFIMKCPKCGSSLVSLYCRNGAGGKRWVKIKDKYCKVCNRVMKG